ncbi:MAG: hypothetical protein D6734_00785 [Candidatus Schekmanbacteria bacterium]|nr:MAG: hypothetical protein D6734_00785 [Candidatus Schekmanbacteria bacterium]
MPKITIDGKEFEFEKGESILQVAERNGIEIPHFCYHKDLPWAGNCRMCQVEVEKMPKLVISCATVAQDGMVVHTNSPRVRKAVRGVLEFLLLNHPIDCPICDQAGECYLQDYYMKYGLHDSRIDLSEKVRKRKAIRLGDMIVLDTERCVLCSRCIRFCEHITKTGEFGFSYRGNRTEIGTFYDAVVDNPYSGNLVDICPVGAITSRDFRFKCRVWFLESTETICPSCSTGCNIFLDTKDGIAYRIRPRYNPDVNKSWICNEGRLSYKLLNDEARLLQHLEKENGAYKSLSYENAIEKTTEKIKRIVSSNNEKVLAIASPDATNEDIYLFKKVFSHYIRTPHIYLGETSGKEDAEKREDQILRRIDKHPNTMGAIFMGISTPPGGKLTPQKAAEIIKANDIKMLYFMSPSLIKEGENSEEFINALKGVELIIIHSMFVVPSNFPVNYVFASSSYAEVSGTFTNYAGKVQRIKKALPNKGDARGHYEILQDILFEISGEKRYEKVEEIFEEIKREYEQFSNL